MIRALFLFLFAAPLLPSVGVAAWGCDHETSHVNRAGTDGVAVVEVYARAGKLEINGVEGQAEAVATGSACVSRKGMLEETGITVAREGDRLRVLVELPDTSDETGDQWRGKYAVMDLEVEVPEGMDLVVVDSSGDIRIRDVGGLEITDSSGDIDARHLSGDVLIPKDSSGDIHLSDTGDVLIQIDSSGNIDIRDTGSVTIANDTSGDIDVRNASGDVTVGNDSSGKISVENVGGSFSVANDTSGGIRHREVAGTVSLPPNSDR